MLPIAFSPTDPRCHGNEIWDKIGYNSVCVRDICEIFAYVGQFSEGGHQMLLITEFYPDRGHGNKINDRIWHMHSPI